VAELRHALGHLPTGVTVVTSLVEGGGPIGTAVSAVCSLSAQPALLLACLARSSATLDAIRAHRAFAVNVLADDQHPLSANFARPGAAASWRGVGHEPLTTGLPRLQGTIAALDCVVHELLQGRRPRDRDRTHPPRRSGRARRASVAALARRIRAARGLTSEVRSHDRPTRAVRRTFPGVKFDKTVLSR
jgi:hypothetical protein